MITLLHGDSLDILPTLAAGSVQAVVTSPPYFALRDYGIEPSDWPQVRYVPLAGVPPIEIPPAMCCLGLEDDPLTYVAHLVHVFRLLRPVLRDDGVCWLNLGDSYAQPSKWGGRSGNKNRPSDLGRYPRRRLRSGAGHKDGDLYGIPWSVALALKADGWWLRAETIWEKLNGQPERVDDRPTRGHEQIFLLAKSREYFCDMAAIQEPYAPDTARRYERGFRDVHANGRVDLRGYRGPPHGKDGPKLGTGRNRRSVWRLACGRYKEAHFATFPEDLVEPCILAGTSARGACPACGAPWRRLSEATGHVNGREVAHQPGRRDSTKTDSTRWAARASQSPAWSWTRSRAPARPCA
jgi:DNA modification methylase